MADPDRVAPSEKMIKLVRLVDDTGTGLEQKNGQRVYGPRPGAMAPPRGSEVFVARLPRDCFEDEIVPVFSQVETIYEMRLLMDFSGSNRGYAFIKYDSPEAAHQAVEQLNGYAIRPGWRIGVVISLDNCRLYVGGLPRTLTKSELWEEVASRVEGVTDVTMLPDCNNRNQNRGYAFVELESHRLASLARRSLVGQLNVRGRQAIVDWAEPENSVSPSLMKKVKALYLRNLSKRITEGELRTAVEGAVGCETTRVKKIKNYAFVHFKDRKNAELAHKKLQDFTLGGEKVEVTWARPVAGKPRYLDWDNQIHTKVFESLAQKYNQYLYNERKRDGNSSGYGGGSEYGGGSCSPDRSLPTPPPPPPPPPHSLHFDLSPPVLLKGICAWNQWDEPFYQCQLLQDRVHWEGQVRLSIGPPLLYFKQEFYTANTTACFTAKEAETAAAQAALDIIQLLQNQWQQVPPPISYLAPALMPPPSSALPRWSQ